jgi:glyoxylase-like metal-dependent hydrolase (beta-lactamase superfamily II)
MDFSDSGHIRRVGDDIVNSYLIDESGFVTVIDAAVPGYWKLLPGALAKMGRTLEDVRAIVLTHGHSDHIGFAERARRERGWPVSVYWMPNTSCPVTAPLGRTASGRPSPR